MPTDSLHCLVAANELNEYLSGGRIDKISMPEPDEIVLFIHSKRGNHACVMSANPSLPRVHVTEYAPKGNPLTAPSFLMHLRKHINGATVKKVSCRKGERIIIFELAAHNELGYEEDKTLICEIMGKYANVILCDGVGKISECLKHVSPASSEKRPVLPGLKYEFPPAQNKIDLYDPSALEALLRKFGGGKLDGYILTGGSGLAPATITGIVTKVLGSPYSDGLTETQISSLVNGFARFTSCEELKPCVRKFDGKSDFWLYPLYPDGDHVFFSSLNAAMDEHFYALDRDRRLQEKARAPKTIVKNAIARTEKKLKLFSERHLEASDLEHDKLCGELITANIYRLRQGMKSFEAENYYEDPPSTVTVTLNENKSPQYNAQAYYKRYAKKKKTLSMIEEQTAEATADLDYYNSIYDSLSYTDPDGLDEIITELTEAGLMHAQKEKRKAAKKTVGGELTIDGCVIRWGKTNLQNDYVTKHARPTDVWLHTQKIHGSHTVISGDRIGEKVLLRAAEIAAYYSKARLSQNVPVDYTLVKHVSKPKGSPPGKVIYTDYKTLYVNPKDERE